MSMSESEKPVRVAIVGLGFGAEFIPIYQAHPNAELAGICQRDDEARNRVGDQYGVERRYADFEELLADPGIDAVHLNTPIELHASQSIAALEAGKHVACTVPMAISIEDCERVVAAQRASGKRYMMMETAIYTREFLYARHLLESGRLGRLQFLRGAHIQDMTGWPAYWRDLPPMFYATHAVGPLLALAGTLAESVRCLGSGAVDRSDGSTGPSFAVESALFSLAGSDLAMEVTRSLYDVAREYTESFSAYGSRSTLEWQQLEHENPVLFEGEVGARVEVPDFAHLLPPEIQGFTRAGVYSAEHPHLSFVQGGGHGGSHPHLVHEFVSSVREDRPSFPDAAEAANWTAAGICAHTSAMRGEEVRVPAF